MKQSGGGLREYIIAVGVVATTWQVASVMLGSPALPPPMEVLRATAEGLRSDLGLHLGVSAFRAVASIILGSIIGVPLGLVLGRTSRLDRLVAPLLYLIYPVPKVVFLPLIMLLLGLGDASKIFLITMIVCFQILVVARDAGRAVNKQLVLSLVSLGATELQMYLHVVLPSALPKILTALRVSLGTAVAVLFIAETFATRVGLGYFIMDAWSRQAFPELFSGVLAMGALGLALFFALDRLERRLCPWQHL